MDCPARWTNCPVTKDVTVLDELIDGECQAGGGGAGGHGVHHAAAVRVLPPTALIEPLIRWPAARRARMAW
jgi:hypothetical protein